MRGVSVGKYARVQVPEEARIECHIPWSWSDILMWMMGTKPVLSKEHAHRDLQPLIYNALVLKKNVYIKAGIFLFHGGILLSSHVWDF